jgi:hypothetical protein
MTRVNVEQEATVRFNAEQEQRVFLKTIKPDDTVSRPTSLGDRPFRAEAGDGSAALTQRGRGEDLGVHIHRNW